MDIFCGILLVTTIVMLILAEYYMKGMVKEISRLTYENTRLKLQLNMLYGSIMTGEGEK